MKSVAVWIQTCGFDPDSLHLAAVRELPKTRLLLTTNLTAVTTEQHDIACDDNSSGV
jgi:hypothetical protein